MSKTYKGDLSPQIAGALREHGTTHEYLFVWSCNQSYKLLKEIIIFYNIMGAFSSIFLNCIDRLKDEKDKTKHVNITCNCCDDNHDEFLFKDSRNDDYLKE